MKKTLAMLLALVMAASMFTGCASTTTATTEAAPAATTEAAPAAEEAAPAAEEAAPAATAEAVTAEEAAPEVSADEASLLGSDGNPLLVYGEARAVPEIPADEEGALMWSMEYAGRTTEKAPMIPSDGSGIEGKTLIMIGQSEHPYWTAIANGFTAACDFYGADLTIWNPNGDLNQQNQYIDMAIAEQCDMIFLATLDATASEQQFKKIYDAGIPCIAFNMVPSDAAMQYAIGLTGPDDFGQFKMLAEYMATELGGEAGVCYMTHLPGGSPYYARTTNVINYFAEYYPNMTTLDIQSPGFEATACKQVAADWITRFGDEMTAIVLADDSAQAQGVVQALEEAGRTDVMIIAAGNSTIGMDLVAAGSVSAITYQSAEADGAVAVKLAADYFGGVDIGTNAVYYLPQAVITPENVEDYMPAQW